MANEEHPWGRRVCAAPLRGPRAARIAALDPTLGLAYEAGDIVLFQRAREEFDLGDVDLGRGAGALIAIEPIDYEVARRPRALEALIEDDARRIVYINRRGRVIEEMEEHNDAVEASARRVAHDEIAGAARYYAGRVRGVRHVAVDGLAART